MYAIVKTGGKQYKVAEGDVIEVEKLDAAPGAEVALPALLLVDEGAVTHDADKLAKVNVTAQVVALLKGPKIRIHKFKNKTGYHKRQGHRQQLTQLKVTGISSDGAAKKAAAKKAPADTSPAEKAPAKKAAAKKSAAKKAPAKKAAADTASTSE